MHFIPSWMKFVETSGEIVADEIAVDGIVVDADCIVMTLLSTPWLPKLKLTVGSTLCLKVKEIEVIFM